MKKYDIYLFMLALSIAIIIHYPLIPHEIGWDSFRNHRIAESIIYYHSIKWYINPLSLIGYYPYSYPSGVMTYLAEISAMSGVDMEYTILIFTFAEAVLLVFLSFFLSKRLFGSKPTRWILVYVMSFTPGILYFSLWTVSTRGLASIFMIFLIYLLLETENLFVSRRSQKFLILLIIGLLFIPTIHRVWIIILLFIVVFIIARVLIVKFNLFAHKKLYYLIPALIFIIILGSMEFTRFIYSSMWKYYGVYDINDWHTYYLLGLTYGRSNGILIFLLPLGVIYVYLHRNRESFYVLLFIIFLLPFYYIGTYTSVISYVVFPILISFGIAEVVKRIHTDAEKGEKLQKFVMPSLKAIVIVLIVLNIIFSVFVQYYHPNLSGNYSPYEKPYMEEDTYNAGVWLKWEENPHIRDGTIVNYDWGRILSVSGDKSIGDRGPFELINDFVDKKDVKVTLNKRIFSWPDIGPFVLKRPYVTQYEYFFPLAFHTPEGSWAKKMQDKFNISFVIININLWGKQQWGEGYPPHESAFFSKIPQENYAIFRNDKFAIYYWSQKIYGGG